MLAIALLFILKWISKGQFISGREFEAMQKNLIQQITDRTAERDYWVKMAVENQRTAQDLTTALQATIEHARAVVEKK